jgi:hypothetical protein
VFQPLSLVTIVRFTKLSWNVGPDVHLGAHKMEAEGAVGCIEENLKGIVILKDNCYPGLLPARRGSWNVHTRWR